MKYKIAVVDDDEVILKMLIQSLESQGYVIETATEGRDAIRLISKSKPDLVILDWNLPEMNGLQICQFLRSNPQIAKIPVLMLTVFGEVSQKVSAFETGADDYLTKPFDIRELLVRVRSLLKRGSTQEGSSEVIKLGCIQMDLSSHKVTSGGKHIPLRPKEFELLYVLLKSQGRVLTRQYLVERVWGYSSEPVTTRTVDSHMARLREKIGPQGANLIQTIPGFGYKMEKK